jgi:RNA polymerase sigma factor (TIGR02999 family)
VDTGPGEVTKLLIELRGGDHSAEERLMPLIYKELRRIARAYMRGESPDNTLQPTALVHEAYMRLVTLQEIEWQNRSHFFAIAATVMRRILVDNARANKAKKRGQGWDAISINEAILPAPERGSEILALDDALERLATIDSRQSKIVELRFFAGMSEEETADALGISSRTVKRDWRLAKAWLFRELNRL